MQITPRLPVHGRYLSSPYLELRYIRCSCFSYPAFLLFRLSELTLLPSFPSLKPTLTTAIDSFSPCIKQVILTSMQASTDITSVWNTEIQWDYTVAQSLGLHMDIYTWNETWGRQIGVQIVRFGYESLEKPGMKAIYYDELEDKTVVLLYREYSWDSFVEVPECGHVVLKAEMYRRAREEMKYPRKREEMNTVSVKCPHRNCQTEVSRLIYDLGTQEAQGYPVTRLSHRKSYGLSTCQKCGRHQAEDLCTELCLLCIKCAAVASCTEYGLSCVICHSRYLQSHIPRILTIRQEISGMSPLNAPIQCRNCRLSHPLSLFSLILATKHGCWLCDTCYPPSQISHWPCCFSETRPSTTPASRSETRENKLICVLCAAENKESCFQYSIRKQHQCRVCDQCFLQKIDRLGHCPLCGMEINWGDAKQRAYKKCDNCQKARHFSDYSLFLYLKNSCLACNQCILSNLKACLVCFRPYSASEFNLILAKSHEMTIQDKRCYCGNVIFPTSPFKCPNSCYCSLCNLTNILLFLSNHCLHCQEPCTGPVPEVIPCSNCARNMQIQGVYVSGVCSSGHLLCKYCVLVHGDQGNCPICLSIVTIRDVMEAKQAQNGLFLGCYCENEGGSDLGTAGCSHVMHLNCMKLLRKCRVCGEKVSFSHYLPKETTIWRYLKREIEF